MNHPAKQYTPVGPVERVTGLCPLYLAFIVTDEVRHYCQADLPDSFSDQLAERAEKVFAHNDDWRRKIKGRHGRDWLLAFMRHWLAAMLWKQRSELFVQLPNSFKIGHPLPLPNVESRDPLSLKFLRIQHGNSLSSAACCRSSTR